VARPPYTLLPIDPMLITAEIRYSVETLYLRILTIWGNLINYHVQLQHNQILQITAEIWDTKLIQMNWKLGLSHATLVNMN
jgi:hypothetical protein